MKLFCKHEWEEIPNTRHIYRGLEKEAKFICTKCHKEKWFNFFNLKPNKYVFKVYRKGQISDGSHTFDELYYHRMVLFSLICNTYKEFAWKSWKHDDNTMYDDYFIVGITTKSGDYSYHYHKDHWDMFDIKELQNAPKYDGHKPSDILRIYDLLENK